MYSIFLDKFEFLFAFTVSSPDPDQNMDEVNPEIYIESDPQDFHCILTLQQEFHLTSGNHSTMTDYDSGFSNDVIGQSAGDDASLEYRAWALKQEYSNAQTVQGQISKSQETQIVKTKPTRRKPDGNIVQMARSRKGIKKRQQKETYDQWEARKAQNRDGYQPNSANVIENQEECISSELQDFRDNIDRSESILKTEGNISHGLSTEMIDQLIVDAEKHIKEIYCLERKDVSNQTRVLEKEASRIRSRVYQKSRRQNITASKREAYLVKGREYQISRRQNMIDSEIKACRIKDRNNKRKKRRNMTETELEIERRKDRDSKRSKLRKITDADSTDTFY